MKVEIFFKGKSWFVSRQPKRSQCKAVVRRVLGFSPVQGEGGWTWKIT